MFNLTDWLTWSPCSLISRFVFLRRYKADEVKNTSLRLQVSFNYAKSHWGKILDIAKQNPIDNDTKKKKKKKGTTTTKSKATITNNINNNDDKFQTLHQNDGRFSAR